MSWTAMLRGYSGNVLEGRIAIVPDVLKPYVKNGKINMKEFRKRLMGEINEAFEKRIWEYVKSDYCTKDFVLQQKLHYKFAKEYVEGKSFYEKELSLERIVEALYAGEIKMTRAGNWDKKVFATIDGITGIVVSQDGQSKFETGRATIHISNAGIHAGIHVVPKKE